MALLSTPDDATAGLRPTLVGTGGIGTGRFFQVDGQDTLGREESRSGRFLRSRDYCKLHIVSHYLNRLLGPRWDVVPIGAVGDDHDGARLRDEMESEGLDVAHVETIAGADTLFSFCILYPDFSGGNLTTGDSASSRVSKERVASVVSEVVNEKRLSAVFALPEVPIEARWALLSAGGARGCTRYASFSSRELADTAAATVIEHVDVLAMNADELAAVIATDSIRGEAALKRAAALLPGVHLVATDGERGSWVTEGERTSFLPAATVPVRGTGGAGDAFFAGIIAGLELGLSLVESHFLGSWMGSASVTSQDTINRELSTDLLLRCADAHDSLPESGAARSLLTGGFT